MRITMLKTGLVSITFRMLSCDEIIDVAQRAGLDAVEWGGDVHVPHGDVELAAIVGRKTVEAGLTVSSYGSYFRPGQKPQKIGMADVVETAKALKAPLIRVWAGDRGSSKAKEKVWKRVLLESRRIADMAADNGIRVAYEFHGNTLTDTNESAAELLRRVDHPNVGVYWQPPSRTELEYCIDGIRLLGPHLANIHAFSWHEESGERLPLSGREDKWRRLLKEISEIPGDRYILLEFVKGESKEQLLEDAVTLKRWIEDI